MFHARQTWKIILYEDSTEEKKKKKRDIDADLTPVIVKTTVLRKNKQFSPLIEFSSAVSAFC